MKYPNWPPRSYPKLELTTFGSFHIGGRSVEINDLPSRTVRLTNSGDPVTIDPRGSHWIGAMYAQYFVPRICKSDLCLQLWHGGALTGCSWETTPDGREGWLQFFVRQGWTTLCCDAVERGRSGFPPVPQVFPTAPIHQPMSWAFERHRIGQGPGSWHIDPSKRRPIAESLFPLEAYDHFSRQLVPRWADSDASTLEAYIELLDLTGPACVIAHSQGCQFALQAAEVRPELFKSLILLEPSGVGSPQGASNFKNTPILVVYGDSIKNNSRWTLIRQKTTDYLEPLRKAGGHVDIWDLPDWGINGNSHMLMMDKNSDEIAKRIQDWLIAKTGS